MSKRYIFIIFILVSAILALLLLPKMHYCSNDSQSKLHYSGKTCQQVNPKSLLLEAINTHRYIDADLLTSKIIGQDPSFLLVDLRDTITFNQYTLPGAINIPYNEILDKENLSLLRQSCTNIVLFSKNTLIADQIWMLLRRKGYQNISVLKGGIQCFFNTIINPKKPSELASNDDFDTYHFRKAAGVYFGLPNPYEFIPKKEVIKKVYIKGVSGKTAKKSVKMVKRDTDEEEEEGC
jgi:rhodanese-related sulfurtransferase